MRDQLLAVIDRFSALTVAVVGDLIADEFLYGEISRISREAPVLVVQYSELVRVPGGAGNAANNLLDLGCRVAVLGAVGTDEAGRDLSSQLRAKGADASYLAEVPGYRTPVKTRILAGAHHSAPQQIVRVDRVGKLEASWLDPDTPTPVLDGCDAVIVSDYGYGAVCPALLGQVRRQALRRRIPVIVDSRFRMCDFERVTAITPNITELEAATGTAIGGDTALLHKVSRGVLKRQKLECLLVTQGRFGMTLFEHRRPPLHIPIHGTDEVADVTGAGDTVIAVFGLALAAGASPAEAARLSNYAGGIVVMKRGTATLTSDELRSAVTCDLSSPAS
jgi:D-glycero-beta-D-manno-heptose-7-phosphate kinase